MQISEFHLETDSLSMLERIMLRKHAGFFLSSDQHSVVNEIPEHIQECILDGAFRKIN